MPTIAVAITDNLRAPRGGLGEQCRNILREFEAWPDWRFVVIGDRQTSPEQGPNYLVGPVDYVPYPFPMVNGLAEVLWAQPGFLSTLLRFPHVDLVHAYDWSTALGSVYASAHLGKPLVMTLQLSIDKLAGEFIAPEEAKLHNANCAVEMAGLIYSSAIIHVSPSYARKFPGCFDYKSVIVPNGIRLEDWQSPQPFTFPGNHDTNVVFIGRCTSQKGIEALMAAPLPEGMGLHFVISENGSDPQLLEALTSRFAGSPQVHFLGSRYGQEKVDILCAADAVVMPSVHEPFGIVALEAMASRSVLLTSFVDGLGDFVPRDVAIDTGLTGETLAAAYRHLQALALDERGRRIEGGLVVCRQYTWRAAAERLKAVYEQVLALRPAMAGQAG